MTTLSFNSVSSSSSETPPSIIFIHAHPDDEAIFTGGTIARLADAGWRVVVVVATSGELGRPAQMTPGTPLRGQREQEAIAACRLLGVHRVEFLGYGDSGMPGDPANHAPGSFFSADTNEAAERVARIIDSEHTKAVVVYDAGGIYGHPDHIQVHRVGIRAAQLTNIKTVYQATIDREYLHFVETHIVDFAREAVPSHLASSVGVPSVMVTTVIDVRNKIDVKRASIAAHTSQIPATSLTMTMANSSFSEVYGYEWYVREGPAGPLDDLVR